MGSGLGFSNDTHFVVYDLTGLSAYAKTKKEVTKASMGRSSLKTICFVTEKEEALLRRKRYKHFNESGGTQNKDVRIKNLHEVTDGLFGLYSDLQ